MRPRPGFYLRVALIADLWVYLLVLVLFVYLPLFPVEVGERLEGNEVTLVEWVLVSLATVPAYLLAGRLFVHPALRFNEWAYLVTAGYGLLVLAGFLSFGVRQVIVETPVQAVVIAMTFVGVSGAAGAHVCDGGRQPNGTRIERWVAAHERGDV